MEEKKLIKIPTLASTELVAISDSEFKHIKKSRINFSTNYLTFQQEIELMIIKHFTIILRNVKTLLFILLSPIILMTILQIIQTMSDYYTSSLVVKEHPIIDLNSINLKCNNTKGCISLGISILVKYA
jgi:hypothetical protein